MVKKDNGSNRVGGKPRSLVTDNRGKIEGSMQEVRNAMPKPASKPAVKPTVENKKK